jgi:hypothetical protein
MWDPLEAFQVSNTENDGRQLLQSLQSTLNFILDCIGKFGQRVMEKRVSVGFMGLQQISVGKFSSTALSCVKNQAVLKMTLLYLCVLFLLFAFLESC